MYLSLAGRPVAVPMDVLRSLLNGTSSSGADSSSDTRDSAAVARPSLFHWWCSLHHGPDCRSSGSRSSHSGGRSGGDNDDMLRNSDDDSRIVKDRSASRATMSTLAHGSSVAPTWRRYSWNLM